jgi:hypothetical protein
MATGGRLPADRGVAATGAPRPAILTGLALAALFGGSALVVIRQAPAVAPAAR